MMIQPNCVSIGGVAAMLVVIAALFIIAFYPIYLYWASGVIALAVVLNLVFLKLECPLQ